MECDHHFDLFDRKWKEREIDVIEVCKHCDILRKTHFEWDGTEDYSGSFSQCVKHEWSTMVRSMVYGGDEKEYRLESMCSECGCMWFRHYTPKHQKFVKN